MGYAEHNAREAHRPRHRYRPLPPVVKSAAEHDLLHNSCRKSDVYKVKHGIRCLQKAVYFVAHRVIRERRQQRVKPDNEKSRCKLRAEAEGQRTAEGCGTQWAKLDLCAKALFSDLEKHLSLIHISLMRLRYLP